MAEWLYEEGIGENRAILVEHGAIVEAAIELPGHRAGAVLPVRLVSIAGVGTLDDDTQVIVSPLPCGVTEGAIFLGELIREEIPEADKPKPARVRPSRDSAREGPDLANRIGAPAPPPNHGPDRFEAAGWSELLDEAMRGEIAFPGGALRMSVTPAMTLFDVDGSLPPAALAEAGAAAAARAIRRLGIAGSIGIDLPTLGRDARQAAAHIFDAILPQPFERAAVNGFGFLHVVRRRERPSLSELLQADPVGAAARALLRQAERHAGAVILHAAPKVIARIEAGPAWTEQLARRIGGTVALRADPGLAISAGYVEPNL